jgi:hypothetical protein
MNDIYRDHGHSPIIYTKDDYNDKCQRILRIYIDTKMHGFKDYIIVILCIRKDKE